MSDWFLNMLLTPLISAVQVTVQKMKFSVKKTRDLFTFAKEILNAKLVKLKKSNLDHQILTRPSN